jgi:hypothetical protein
VLKVIIISWEHDAKVMYVFLTKHGCLYETTDEYGTTANRRRSAKLKRINVHWNTVTINFQ